MAVYAVIGSQKGESVFGLWHPVLNISAGCKSTGDVDCLILSHRLATKLVKLVARPDRVENTKIVGSKGILL